MINSSLFWILLLPVTTQCRRHYVYTCLKMAWDSKACRREKTWNVGLRDNSNTCMYKVYIETGELHSMQYKCTYCPMGTKSCITASFFVIWMWDLVRQCPGQCWGCIVKDSKLQCASATPNDVLYTVTEYGQLTLDSYVCQGQANKKLVWQIRRSII